MVLSFVAIVLAFLWLCHRATRLLRIPIPYLVQTLGVDIPEIPRITLDSVTSNTVLFHWSCSEKNVLRLIFYLDGKRAGETDRLNAAIVLKGLKPNTNYTLSAVAVNPNNYKSLASVTRFHTQHPLNEYNETNQDPLKSLMADDNTAASLLSLNTSISTPIKQNPKTRKRAHTTSTPGKSRNLGPKNTPNGKVKTDTKAKNVNEPIEPYTVESLTSEIESMQLDLQEAIANKSEQEKSFSSEESSLVKLLAETQAQSKSEEAVRSQLRSENKALEDVRHGLETEMSKIERLCKKLKDTINRRYQQMEKWQAEMEEADKNLMRSDNVIATMSKKYEKSVSDLKEDMTNVKKEVTSIEKEVKKLNLEIKKLQSIRTATLESIDEIKKKSDPNSGVVAEEVLRKVISQQNIHDCLKKALQHEVEIETKVEEKWIDDQKDLEKRYLVAYKQFQESNSAYQRAKDAYNEYVASFSMPESLAPTKSSVSIGTDHNIYPSTSNSTPGKKRKNRSRRNTKSDGNGPNKAFPQPSAINTNEQLLSVPLNNNTVFTSPAHSFQSLSYQPSFTGLAQSNASVGGFSVNNNDSLFPTQSSGSFLPNVQNSTMPSDGLVQTQNPNTFHNLMQSSSLPDMTHTVTNPKSISVNTQFSPMSDMGDLQSPSAFVPSYIIKDDTVKDDYLNFSFPVDNLHSSVSLAAPSLTSQVSPVTRPSAGYLARALHQRTGSSDSVNSGRLSVKSAGFHDELDIFSQDYINSKYNGINHQSLSAAPSISSLNESLTKSNAIVAPLEKDDIKSGKGSSMFSSLFGSLKSKQSKKGAHSEQPISNGLSVGIIGHNLDQNTIGNSQTSEQGLDLNNMPLPLGEPFNPNYNTNPWNPVGVNTFGPVSSHSKSESTSSGGWSHDHNSDTLDPKSPGSKHNYTDDPVPSNSITSPNHKSRLLQKGIRTLSLQRKAINPTNSSDKLSEPESEPPIKFTKRLSIFGSKDNKEKYEETNSNDTDSTEEKKDYHELLDRMRK